MSRKKLFIIVATICLGVFIIIGVAFADLGNKFQISEKEDELIELEKYEDFDSILAEIQEWDLDTLIHETTQLAKAISKPSFLFKEEIDHDILTPFAVELFNRSDEFSNDELIELMKDDTKEMIIREIFVDLYLMKNENNFSAQNDLKQLLQQDEVDSRLKQRIVSLAYFTKDEVPLLKALIQDEDPSLAFDSLNVLTSVDINEAYIISKEILIQRKVQPDEKVSAALRATAKYLNEISPSKINSHESLEKNFIELCLEIINSTNNLELKDSAFFAISEIGTYSALKEIINNNTFDRAMKRYGIHQNFMVLIEVLENNPSSEDIELVIEALRIYPIIEIAESLERVMSQISDEDLQQSAQNIIEFVKEEEV